ncbi:MAG: glycerol-3-phosphate 1-O-acyltransferase PlsB [Xanthomonadales bacterium]|nr:glycerol-3-phosphate 1-O-acyltransferase PlsB [Xanthomonadales bacterium]
MQRAGYNGEPGRRPQIRSIEQMSTELPQAGFFNHLRLRWFLLLRSVLHGWIKATVLPKPFEDLEIDLQKPICYVIDSYALTTLLILDRCCENLNLPRPLWPMQTQTGIEPRSYLALRRQKGLIISKTTVRTHSETLKRLVDKVWEGREEDIQLVPVTVLIGRAPDKETGLAKIFFTESWEIGGRIRRLFGSLINGRNTMVHFSDAVSLRALASEDIGAARGLRKVLRILRVQFRRVRSAAIGPDLSHRRTVVDQVLASKAVKKAIRERARREKTSEYKSWKQARNYAYEIAADYSYAFVRLASFALTWFWNRIYDGVELQHFREFEELAPDYEVIYVPCHRSHIDYLLVSYLVYHNGLVPPHVAAGINLNLPLLGRVIRKGGAFYLRRSFRSKKLYSAVFHEYLSRILSNGTAIEYFIEGTRSRTGRLLQPKGGMLSMTVRSYLQAPKRPIMFQPIYVGYERLVEGKSYTAELSGQIKKNESLTDLLKVFGVLRQRYGKVHVSFAKPVFLDEVLDSCAPDWRAEAAKGEGKPPWLNPLVDQLGARIMTAINAAAHVNAINLLALVLLTQRKHALGRKELLNQLALYQQLLKSCAYSDQITHTSKSPLEIIAYGLELRVIEIRERPLGDIVALVPEPAVLLAYFRNNVAHLAAIPSLIASCFLNSRSIASTDLRRLATALYPYLKSELFLPWDETGLLRAIDRHVDWLVEHGLLTRGSDGQTLERAAGGDPRERQLRIMGYALLQTFERYYLTVAILAKNGPGTLTRNELERLCILTAQRLAELNEFAAPEFYDRNLFRQFISNLRETGALTTTDDDKLDFGAQLERISEDAKFILSKEIRHGIIRVAPQLLEPLSDEEDS